MTEARLGRQLEARLSQRYVFSSEQVGFTPRTIVEARERKILQEKVVLVVGASPEGIGGAAAREAILQGATVVTNSRDKEDNAKSYALVDELKARGGNAMWIGADVRDKDAGKVLVSTTVREFGKLDGVIIAAGVRDDFPFFAMSDERMKSVFETNFFGPMRVVQAAYNQMRKQKPPQGWITLISSVAGIEGIPGQLNYAPSKAAMHNAVTTIANEIEEYKRKRQPDLDICINALAPGLTTTPLVRDVKPDERRVLLALTGAKRELDPNEVGKLAVHLTSPAAKGVTGKIVAMVGR